MNGFTGGTIVITPTGLKQLKNLEKGDMVMNADNKFDVVESVESFESDDIYIAKDFFGNGVYCTGDCCVYTTSLGKKDKNYSKITDVERRFWYMPKISNIADTSRGVISSCLEWNNLASSSEYPPELFICTRHSNGYRIEFLEKASASMTVYSLKLKKSKGILLNGIIFLNS